MSRSRSSASSPDASPSRRSRPIIEVARVYEAGRSSRAPAILVDRLWPRGLRRDEAPFETWLKDVAPSPDLRTWYGHDPAKFEEFARRYREELEHGAASEAFRWLLDVARRRGIVLVTATKDVEHSGAAVLASLLTEALGGEGRR